MGAEKGVQVPGQDRSRAWPTECPVGKITHQLVGSTIVVFQHKNQPSEEIPRGGLISTASLRGLAPSSKIQVLDMFLLEPKGSGHLYQFKILPTVYKHSLFFHIPINIFYL